MFDDRKEHKGLGAVIWNRDGRDEMSTPAFVRAIALSTLVMAVVVAVGAIASYDRPFTWWLLIGTFVCSIVFIIVFTASSNPIVSFMGVSGMSLCLGLMIGPLVATYTSDVVMAAILTTMGVMAAMSIVGIMFPKTFEGWGTYLIGALWVLIFALFGQIIFAALGFEWAMHGSVLDQVLLWGGILIFTFFVAYDWSKALSLPKTWDNAIDASGGLILDAVNLFIRFLEVYARSQR